MFPEITLAPLTYSAPQVPKAKPRTPAPVEHIPATNPKQSERSAAPEIVWLLLALVSVAAARVANFPEPYGAILIIASIGLPFVVSMFAFRDCNSKNADGVTRCRNKRSGFAERCQHENHAGFNLFDLVGVGALAVGVVMLAWWVLPLTAA